MNALLGFVAVTVIGGSFLIMALLLAKWVDARISATSVATQVVEIDGARYIVVTTTDGVAICPVLAR